MVGNQLYANFSLPGKCSKTNSLFESELNKTTIHDTGAVFNDYDYNTENLLTSITYDDVFSSTSTKQ